MRSCRIAIRGLSILSNPLVGHGVTFGDRGVPASELHVYMRPAKWAADRFFWTFFLSCCPISTEISWTFFSIPSSLPNS